MKKTYEQLLKCNCATAQTLSLIGGKWKVLILNHLAERSYGFNELQRSLYGITAHTLTQTLKELVEDQLIVRTDFQTNPPKTQYSLSKTGQELKPLLSEITRFGEEYPALSLN